MANALDDALRGRVLANRYCIEGRLGAGAMGIVYRARHIKLARIFAVKVLHPQLLTNEKVKRRFEREAELAATVRHDNVIGVVDVGETADGLHYLVMDFAEGESLGNVMAKGPMPSRRMLHLAQQLCDGLGHAHEAGLIHRDFKPDNVIVQQSKAGEETPRIVDFGIALLRDDASPTERERLTTAGMVLGTPHYMAPEHASGGTIDHRIDLFALGVICFEMLTGRMPFDGDGVDVARANIMFDPPRMRELVPHVDIDPLLEAFTRKLMARDLDERFATARDARAVLDLIERDRDAAAIALGLQPAPAPAAPAPRPMLAMPIITPNRARAAITTPPGAATSTTIVDKETIKTHPLKRSLPLRYVIAATIAAFVVVVSVVALRGPTQMSSPPAPAAATATSVQSPPLPAIAIPITPPNDAHVERSPVPPAPPKVGVAKVAKKAPFASPPIAHPLPPTKSAPPMLTPSAAELAQQYANVGRKLTALEKARGLPATLALWPRYRNIRIQALFAQPEDRRAGTLTLREIEGAVDAAMRAGAP